MKTFIVFLSLLILNISFSVFACDMKNFSDTAWRMKLLADECAAGAALMPDETAYSEGYIKPDISDTEANLKNTDGGRIIIHLLDEYNDYSKEDLPLSYGERKAILSSAELTEDKRGVRVTVKCDTKNFFHVPVSSVSEIRRTSVCRWD